MAKECTYIKCLQTLTMPIIGDVVGVCSANHVAYNRRGVV